LVTFSHRAAIAGVGLGVAEGAGLADRATALDGVAALVAGDAELPHPATASRQQVSKAVRRMACMGTAPSGRDGLGTEAEPGQVARSALFYIADV
jgi:hypothetical protein